MRQLRWAACVSVAFLACSTGSKVEGQGYVPTRPGGISPITSPVYSPYLNLLRPGGTTAQNYFGLVRPEFDLRNATGTLQQQNYQTDQSLNNLAYGVNGGYAPLVTGHVATFLNTRGHFLNLRGAGAGGGGAGGYGGGGYGGGGYGGGGYGAGARSFGAGAAGAGLGGGGYGGAPNIGGAGAVQTGSPIAGGGYSAYPR